MIGKAMIIGACIGGSIAMAYNVGEEVRAPVPAPAERMCQGPIECNRGDDSGLIIVTTPPSTIDQPGLNGELPPMDSDPACPVNVINCGIMRT